MLSAVIADSVFVDLFAGTGAVGLEALSRGARSVTWVERDRRTAFVLAGNVDAVAGAGFSRGRVAVCDALKWLEGKAFPGDGATVAYADPPYGQRGEADITDAVLAAAAAGGRLSPGAVFVVEQRTGSLRPGTPGGWRVIDERSYGNTRLLLYRTPE